MANVTIPTGLQNTSFLDPNLGMIDYSNINSINYPTINTNTNLGNINNTATGSRKVASSVKADNWLDNLSNYADIGLKGLSAGVGLANSWTGYKNYKQAQEKFKFEKALAERNLANQAQLINRAIDASANISAGLSNPTRSSSLSDAATRDRYLADATSRKVASTL